MDDLTRRPVDHETEAPEEMPAMREDEMIRLWKRSVHSGDARRTVISESEDSASRT